MSLKHAAAKLAAAAAVAAAIEAGGVVLTGRPLLLAIGEIEAPKHVKAALTAIAAHQNDNTGEAFPGYERIAKWGSVSRRTAITRVNLCRELELERHGVRVVVDPRWHSSMRGPRETNRANHYRLFWAPEIAAKVGVKLHDPGSAPFDDDAGADWFAAPAAALGGP